MDKFLMDKKAVFVHLILIGMVNGVKLIVVVEVKNGMEPLVHVSLDKITMEAYACSVSMVKNGIPPQKNVNAQEVLFGMEISVKNSSFVLATVFSMKLWVSVYVLPINFGMDSNVWFNLTVAVEKYGTKKHSSVIVLIISIGMEQVVCFVWMVKSGTVKRINACVEKERSGMGISVLLFKNVLVEQSGIKILGLVNVHQWLFGTENTVKRIPVLVVSSGTEWEEDVNVHKDYNSLEEYVNHPHNIVPHPNNTVLSLQIVFALLVPLIVV